MQCAALASTTGLRCKLDAEPGAVFCKVPKHRPGAEIATTARQEVRGGRPELLEDGAEAPTGPDPAGGAAPGPSSPNPTPSEPDTADFSGPSDLHPSGSGPDTGLQEHPGPEAEEAAAAGRGPRDGDPDLFAGLRPEPSASTDGAQEDRSGEVVGHLGPEGHEAAVGPDASLLDRFPGPFGAADGGKMQKAVCNRVFRRYGKDPLTPEEVEFGGEAWAALVNYYLSQVDPNSPWGAWFLSVAVTAGPRFAPDLAGRVVGRVRGNRPERGAPRGPEPQEVRAGPDAELQEDEDGGADDLDSWTFPGGVAR